MQEPILVSVTDESVAFPSENDGSPGIQIGANLFRDFFQRELLLISEDFTVSLSRSSFLQSM